jgi:beta-N-acetylhexosaminidase
MLLFTRNLDEDLGFMKDGLRKGTVTRERLDEAVTRVLGLKAALGLHKRKAAGSLVPDLNQAMSVIGSEEHKRWAKEVAEKGPTLVKEEPGVLPLSPEKYKRVLFYEIEAQAGFAYTVRTGAAEAFRKALEAEGFDITKFEPTPGAEGMVRPYSDVVGKYDLIVYLANMSTKSNQTTVRIEWAQPMGANVPIFMTKVPTIFVSLENPYHLLDVPRVRTFVNAYSSTDDVIAAVVAKLTGKSSFKGINPIDPFCGRWDTRLS